jgi:hypothetical protein
MGEKKKMALAYMHISLISAADGVPGYGQLYHDSSFS